MLSRQSGRALLAPSRREWLRETGYGIGGIALAQLLATESIAAQRPNGSPSPRGSHNLLPKQPDFRPRAKSIILLMQNGAPSQIDLFDPKPELSKRSGQVHVEKVETFQNGSEDNRLLGTPYKFYKRGACQMDFSEALPHMASLADEWCMVRSMHTHHNNHTEALVIFATGKFFAGRPTLGAWVGYGLGTENQDLPSYIVLRDPQGYSTNGTELWQSGWLPAIYRGTEFRSQGSAVLNLRSNQTLPDGVRRNALDLLENLNRKHLDKHPGDSELESRIFNYELAARMQLSANNVVDISKESAATRSLYGLDQDHTANYGKRCLMARRLIEAGVRFVQVLPPAKSTQPWDSHSDTKAQIGAIAPQIDQPSAALIRDLKSRGLLEETIVIWAGEFGRLPVSQHSKGRDHNRNAFTILIAGGGFKSGFIHGATDELGYRSVDKRVSVADLHATLLHQLGIDHRKLSYPHLGREETLTDRAVTRAHVVGDLLNHSPQIT